MASCPFLQWLFKDNTFSKLQAVALQILFGNFDQDDDVINIVEQIDQSKTRKRK